jgi:hypothetical protein
MKFGNTIPILRSFDEFDISVGDSIPENISRGIEQS